MGYQKLTLGAGFNWVAPQFLAVGENPINIQSIQLEFAEGTSAQGGDSIQILDEGGATIHTYFWGLGEWVGSTVDGWINEEYDGLATITLDPGQSILLDCEQAGTKVKIFGEVSGTDYVTTAVQGFNFVGNTTPVPINVQDIQLDFGSGVAQGGDSIQILDEGGATLETYFWGLGEWVGSQTDGWINETYDGLADFTLDPGQGILIDSESAGTVITVPSAL